MNRAQLHDLGVLSMKVGITMQAVICSGFAAYIAVCNYRNKRNAAKN
jgi:hypothetical protein